MELVGFILFIIFGDYLFVVGKQVVEFFLVKGEFFEVIFVVSDDVVVGVIYVVQEYGIKVFK